MEYVLDWTDVTHVIMCRSDLAWKRLFKDAGLTLVREQTQGGFPDEIYEVKMWVAPPSFVPDTADTDFFSGMHYGL
jgi:hypothetical protein